MADRDRTPVGVLKLIAFATFWGWLVVRWVNDWTGGILFPVGEPLLPIRTLDAIGRAFAGTPIGGFFETFEFIAPFLPRLAGGVWLTVVLTVGGIALGFVIAVPLAAARVYGHYTRYLSVAYIELIRGTPLLAQLFVLYYGTKLSIYVREFPGIGQGIVPPQAVWVALIGFTINSAAYQAEYIRGAIQSVDTGQLQAARAIGLDKLSGIRYVVMPQALRYAIPGWSNELIYLIKYSSLAAFITVPELFNRVNSIASSNFRYTTLFVTAGVIYLCIVLTASNVMSRVEDYVAIPGLSASEGR